LKNGHLKISGTELVVGAQARTERYEAYEAGTSESKTENHRINDPRAIAPPNYAPRVAG
jgi:hypothetical protein